MLKDCDYYIVYFEKKACTIIFGLLFFFNHSERTYLFPLGPLRPP